MEHKCPSSCRLIGIVLSASALFGGASAALAASPAPIPTTSTPGPLASPSEPELQSLPIVPAGLAYGIYLEERADGTELRPVAGVMIGLFSERFVAGPDFFSPPPPIATTVSDESGVFSFAGLAPGTYFVTTIGSAAYSSGVMVWVTGESGGFLILVGCTDCPVPV